MLDFSNITGWIHDLLASFMAPWLVVLTECVLIGVGLLLAYSLLALFYIYFERRCVPRSSVVSVPTV